MAPLTVALFELYILKGSFSLKNETKRVLSRHRTTTPFKSAAKLIPKIISEENNNNAPTYLQHDTLKLKRDLSRRDLSA